MVEEQKIDQKQKILNSALKIFAQKGYSATSVREIAQDAEVNIAMISYYFGSKLGILKRIMDDFFDGIIPIIQSAIDYDTKFEYKFAKFIREYVNYIRHNYHYVCAVFHEISISTPEIENFKTEKIKMLHDYGRKLLKFYFDEHPNSKYKMSIVWPSIIGMIIFHFRTQHTYIKLSGKEITDEYYEDMIEMITNIVLYGIVSEKLKKF